MCIFPYNISSKICNAPSLLFRRLAEAAGRPANARSSVRFIDFEHVVTLAWFAMVIWWWWCRGNGCGRLRGAKAAASEARTERRRQRGKRGGERERGYRDCGCPINFQLDWLGGAQRRRKKERDVINREGNEEERITTSHKVPSLESVTKFQQLWQMW